MRESGAQVMHMSATLRNRGHSPGARVGFVVLLSTLPLAVLAVVIQVWVRAPRPTPLLPPPSSTQAEKELSGSVDKSQCTPCLSPNLSPSLWG